MPPALDGVRILDLSQGVAGPYAAMLLAEQGADVIKVEPPRGDRARRLAGFHVWNRSKRGIVVDLEGEAGRELTRRLAAACDAVIADFSPGRAEELGLDYVGLSRGRPDLIFCWLPPYGSAGPEAHGPPSEDLVAALGGHMAGQPGDHQGPVYLTLPLAAYGAAFLAAGAVAAALFVRERCGRGQQIEVPWLAGALAMETGGAVRVHRIPTTWGADLVRSPLGHLPAYRLYRAADGWLFIACGHHVFFNRLCIALGRPDLVADPRFENGPWGIAPQENRDAFAEIVGHIIASRPRDEWLRIFAEHDVPSAPVEERADFIDSALVRANGMRLELDDPELGPTVQMGLPLELEGTPGAVRGPAPLLGQHTQEVLAELGAQPAVRRRRGRLPRHALEGMRVVDFSGYIAGSLCPMILADYGADVIKVEPPEGEAFRVLAFAFLGWNRGKRGLALDLHRREGREVAYDLLRSADVLMENFRPGVAERLGLDCEAVRRVNPRIIYSSSGGWGRYEPFRDRPAFDPLLQARSGAMAAQGGRGHPPVFFFGLAITDYAAATLSAYGILAALYARERTGQGQRVSIALIHSIMAVQSGEFLFYEGMDDRDRGGPDLPGRSATYRLFRCADGWLFVAASAEEHWPALAAMVALPDSLAALSPEEALEAPVSGPLARQIAGRFAQELVVTWWERLQAAGVPCAPTPTPQEVLFSPQVVANDLAAQHEHPHWGPVTQTGLLVKFGATPGRLQRPAPLVGQHTQEVLRELGYGEERIAALLAEGVAVQAPMPES